MKAIKMYRLRRGLTQEELAKILNVDRTTVVGWEGGRANPRAKMLPKVARVLDCSVDDLYARK